MLYRKIYKEKKKEKFTQKKEKFTQKKEKL